MKKLLLTALTIALSSFGAKAQITDLPVTASPTSFCSGGSSTISTTGSQVGVNYSLRNSSNTVIAGPIAGTGNDLSFNSGVLANSAIFNVYAEQSLNQSALEFDGINDFIDLTANNRGFNTKLSVGCWVKTTVSGASQIVLSKYSGANGFILAIDVNGKAIFDGKGDQGSYTSSGSSTTVVNDGQWHYIVGTVAYGGGTDWTWRIYVDGNNESSSGTGAGGGFSNSAPFTVGSLNSSYFSGSIDQVEFWSTQLTAAEVAANYTSCLSGSEPFLAGYFDFNEGSGATVTDLTSIGVNGTLTNMNIVSVWGGQSSSPCYSPTSTLQMTQTATVSIIAINDETVSGPASVCSGSSATVSTGSSVVGVNYTLKDGNGYTIDGPTPGTGSGIGFSTGAITNTTTYNVYGEGANSPASNALAFDGVNDYVNLTNSDRSVAHLISVGGWVKTTASGTGQMLVSKYSGASGYILAINASGKAIFDGKGTNGGTYQSSGPSTTTVNDGQWHYIMGTTQLGGGGNWRIYVDGVYESGSASSNGLVLGSGASANLAIGALNSSFANVEIDNVSIWNTVLSPTDVVSTMNNCLVGTETNLVGFFDFNDNNTTTLTDYSSTGIDGTLTNMDPITDWVTSTAPGCSPAGSCSLIMTQTVIIAIDNSGPIADISNLPDITAQCSVTSLSAPTATDNCAGAIIGTHNATLPITANTTITWTYDDGDGNTIMQNQNVVVNDDTAPVATAQNITIQLDAFGAATITAANINNGSTDNCTSIGDLIMSVNRTLFVCADVGSNIAVLSVEDANGNIGTANATVTVEDNVVPVVITRDITVSVDNLPSVSITPQDINNGSSDACGIVSYSLDIDTFTSADVGANTVTLTVTDVNGNSNTGAATVTVTELLAQTITFNAIADKTYGDNNFTLGVTASSGLSVDLAVISGPATISGNNVSITAVGSVIIEATQVGDATYAPATPVQQSFTVNKVPLTVTAEDKSITYGDAIPTLTFAYTGFVNAENIAAIATEPTVSTTASASSNAGSYPITLSGGVANNYSFSFVSGSLLINKANQVLSIDAIADQDFTQVSHVTVSSSSSASLATSLVVSGPATISGNIITLDGTAGTITVTASQVGNNNYSAAADVSTSFNAYDGSNPCIGFSVSLVSSTNNSCNGEANGTIDISVTGGDGNYAFAWSNNTANEDASNLLAGTYTVTVTDGNSCSVTLTETITEPTLIEITAETTDVVAGNDGAADITVTGGAGSYSFSWSNGDNTEDLTNVAAGSYTVTVTDGNGCSVTQTVDVGDIITALKEVATTQVSVYPNPVSDFVKVEGSFSNAKVEVQLINNLGVQVLIKRFENLGSNTVEFPVADLKNGHYLVVITANNTQTVQRINIKH